MSEFVVTILERRSHTVAVEADNPDAAMELAASKFEAEMITPSTVDFEPTVIPPTGASIVRAILKRVAQEHCTTVADILGPSRAYRLVAARRQAMAEAYRTTNLPIERLGEAFRRHHATILYAVRCAGVHARPARTLRAYT